MYFCNTFRLQNSEIRSDSVLLNIQAMFHRVYMHLKPYYEYQRKLWQVMVNLRIFVETDKAIGKGKKIQQ
mgnify:FL=1